MTGLQHFKKNKKAIHSPMFNHHSLIPWGSFRDRQEEKWGSFRGWDHFGVDLGIISGLRIISGSGSFQVLYRCDFRKLKTTPFFSERQNYFEEKNLGCLYCC